MKETAKAQSIVVGTRLTSSQPSGGGTEPPGWEERNCFLSDPMRVSLGFGAAGHEILSGRLAFRAFRLNDQVAPAAADDCSSTDRHSVQGVLLINLIEVSLPSTWNNNNNIFV